MCGVLFSTKKFKKDDQNWMQALNLLSCRGPDQINQVFDSSGTFGHCRLEIIGLGDVGKQPYSDNVERDFLVFNGEIYNYKELGKKFNLTSNSDTQVLYGMLSQGLLEELSLIRGMFAFVYFDKKKNIIITGRDFFGIKPLYIRTGNDGTISFASVAASLALLNNSRSASQVALAGFLAMGFFPSGVSPFAEISKLPKGIIQTWSQNNGHWKSKNQVLTLKSWSTFILSDALNNSVAAHLVSDVPVGVLMSGGVDSTLLAAVVAQHNRDLRTYSLTNIADPNLDESQFAKWNAKLIGSRHTEVEFNVLNSVDLINKIVRTSGEPFGDPAYIPLAVLCERVAQELKVVLAGEGADELFAGYKRYEIERLRDSFLTKYPLRILSKILQAQSLYAKSKPSQRIRGLAAWGETNSFISHSYLLFSEWRAVSDFIPEAAQEALELLASNWEIDFRENNQLKLEENRLFDLNQWLPNVFLEKSDRASMLSGVEIRVPYLDPEVAKSSSLSSPRDSRKTLLRNELLRLLPGVRLPSNKMGLSVNIAKLIGDKELKSNLDFTLHDTSSPFKSKNKKSIAFLEKRAELNPSFGFRLALVGIWANQWLS